MSSASTTKQDSSTTTNDNRVVASDEAIVVGGEASNVTINQVPDEALEVAGDVIQSLSSVASRALEVRQEADTSDSRALGQDLIRIGLPVAAVVWFLGRR